ncbi:iron chelate uptake ABC transporter family permease subunit, partial [Streptomyces prasinopilosus]|uniref:iron chelate uptake ABC transporter family permease subunit n=1 Tax=Streptomyces prasinopilosus TaxID=67344 RepID=UPI000A63EA90
DGVGAGTRPPLTVPGTWRLAAGPYAVLIPRKPLLGTAAVLAVLTAASAVHLAVGEIFVHPLDALRALFGDGSPRDLLVVERPRLPRLQAGLAVGAALGAAGCLMQTLAQNRLATPDTVGLDDGAAAFAVASVTGLTTGLLPSGAALTGTATAAALTLAPSGGAGRGGYRFLVVGLGVGARWSAPCASPPPGRTPEPAPEEPAPDIRGTRRRGLCAGPSTCPPASTAWRGRRRRRGSRGGSPPAAPCDSGGDRTRRQAG